LADRVASCVWLISPELLMAVDERLGEPIDTYVNGSQVWLRDDLELGPSPVGIEWRLHPVAGYRRPANATTEEVFAATVYALRAGDETATALETLWAGLEAFPCDGDEIEPAPLASACTDALGIAPHSFGVVDHAPVADQWERSLGRDVSVIDLLLQQLDAPR
jgi:hypothetical protein